MSAPARRKPAKPAPGGARAPARPALIVTERLEGGRTRAALIDRGRLEDLLIDPPDRTAPAPEALWCARVDRLVPKMGAAFVRLGQGQTGFLRDAGDAREGESLLVQGISHPEPGKAIPVTRRLLFKTRTAILTPDAPGLNLSRRIRDGDARARLEAAVADTADAAGLPEGAGLIVRSLAEGAAEEAIDADVRAAVRAHAAALDALASAREPGLVAAAPDAATLALREWEGEPDASGFAGHDLDEALAALAGAEAPLPSGGWMAVEPTRALVAVDVNTAGLFAGAAALTANLEAAKDLPRQLRLRGLGGQIAVDFAPLPRKDRRRIEDALKGSFGRDPVETSLAGWTPLGLFEIQRKRERRPTADLLGD